MHANRRLFWASLDMGRPRSCDVASARPPALFATPQPAPCPAHTGGKEPLACGGRAADVLAETYTVCYTLSRKAFNELLGPIEDMWRFEALRKARPPRPGSK